MYVYGGPKSNSLSARANLLKTGKACASKIVPDQTAPRGAV